VTVDGPGTALRPFLFFFPFAQGQGAAEGTPGATTVRGPGPLVLTFSRMRFEPALVLSGFVVFSPASKSLLSTDFLFSLPSVRKTN